MDKINIDDIPDFQVSEEEKEKIALSVRDDTKKDKLKELEAQHKKDNNFSDEFLVEAFPDEENLIVQKLEEYWKEAAKIYPEIKALHRMVDRTEKVSMEFWLRSQGKRFEKVKRLLWFQDQIQRLERLKIVYEKKKIEKALGKEVFQTKKERERFDIDKFFTRPDLLVDIASYYGLELKRMGNCYMALCPFREEHHASFAIYQDNWFHCFGCGKHGNLIDYIMYRTNMSFREALEECNRFL